MRRLLASLKATLRSLGWADGLTYLLAQSLLRVSRGYVRVYNYYLVVQPVQDGMPVPVSRGRSIEVREIGPDDPLLDDMPHPSATNAYRFRQGGRCLAALKGGDLVGFIWWVEGPYEEDEVHCLFVPEPEGLAVWDFGVYVSPSNRLGLGFARLWDAANKRLFADGYRYTCSRISAFNPASLTAHRRLGAQVVGQRLFICLGQLELSLSRQRPRINLSVGNAYRPTVRVGLGGASSP